MNFGGISDVKFLMLQLAGNIITGSKEAEKALKVYTDWADIGYLNCFQTQVELLFNLVKTILNTKYKDWFEKNEKELIADALQDYQDFKTEIIRKEQEEYGEHWGTATGFHKMDWTKFNQKFLRYEPILEVIDKTKPFWSGDKVKDKKDGRIYTLKNGVYGGGLMGTEMANSNPENYELLERSV